jgi:hypothetical protein
MFSVMNRSHHWALVVAVSLIAGSGCNSQQAASDAAPDTSHIKELTMLYAGQMNRNAGRPPASEAEFKRSVAENGAALLDSLGVTVDELFISPRDNQPYVILYGNEAAKLISRGIVTHEQTGVDGRRLVGYRGGYVNEVDEVEFRKLVPATP